MPRVVNFLATHEPFASVVKWTGGIAPERTMPAFATQTFRKWFENRTERRTEPDFLAFRERPENASDLRHEHVPRFRSDTYVDDETRHRLNPHAKFEPFSQGRVLLWPDTFNNYLMTGAAKAAVEVLERAGYVVEIPPRPLCCGRPLFDFGMLDRAKRLYRQTLETLRPYLIEGLPIVGLEPSCVASFRDEMPAMLADLDAKRLSKQVFLLSEFLERQKFAPPKLRRKAVVHGHCHHKAVMHMDAEVSLLRKLELDYDLLDSGCCGMAGSFGFEKDKYDVSVKCGERVLLPAVRAAAPDTLIVANGFSCRQQIEQLTDRKPMHLAEVLLLAFEEGEVESPDQERSRVPEAAAKS
jgi:Fe-S oxidoreductase